jgi:hypothetical protein
LLWNSGPPLQFGPEQGRSELSLEITARANPARYVERSPESSRGGAEIALGIICNASVDIDVSVRMTSQGGALDEAFDATLSATSKQVAKLNASLKPSMLHGALELEPNAMGYTFDGIQLSASLAALGVTGTLNGSASMKGVPNGAAVSAPLARWPADSTCQNGGFPVDLDAKLGGFSARDAIALAARAANLQVTWQSGSRSALRVEFSAADSGGACAYGLEPNQFPDPQRLVVAGSAHVATQDQRIDGDWPIQLSGFADDATGLARVELAPDANGALVNGLVESGQFESSYGFHAVDLSGFDKAAADLKLQLTAAGAAGTIEIRGVVIPECQKNPPAPQMTPGGGVGQAGCAGYAFSTVETAQISD